ncbi:hypothetical protein FACS189454_10330 [Planctomycetales bacterium]|nr:hypothetical protein FACS189454_10330 [Planctomycetales bacterium]
MPNNTLLPNIDQFIRYLGKTGWIRLKQDNPDIAVFGTHQFGGNARIGKRPPVIIIPVNDSYSDAQRGIRESISLIAAFRGVDDLELSPNR